MIESVKLETNNGIASVTLNKPESYNAFGEEMIQFFANLMIGLSSDPQIIGVIITGAGKAFCAGGDIKWLLDSKKSYGEAFHSLAAKYHQAILEIRHMPKPVIAAINGLAAGGGFSLCLACDFRVMEKQALLRQAYTSNGLSIDGGGTYTLPRLVGMAKALEIAGLDQPIDSDEALSLGLVTEVVDMGQSLKRATELIHEIKKVSPTSFAASKKLINDSFHTPFEAQLEKERELLSLCAEHPNGKEGIAAFLEKRRPNYT